MSLFEWIEMSMQLQAEGLEFYTTFLDSLEPDYLQKVRAAVEAKGMCIPMFCSSCPATEQAMTKSTCKPLPSTA